MSCTTKLGRLAFFLLAVLTAALPFAAPAACADALSEGLALCGGGLLASLFPFLIVSVLLVRSGAAGTLGAALRPAARLCGVKSKAAGGVLLLGLTGGFAPAASAAAEAVRAGELSPEEAARLLPACICSGPSFVILTVGEQMLGSAGLGARLFAAQVLAGYLAAFLLRLFRRKETGPAPARPAGSASAPACALDQVIANAAVAYLKLCGFVLYFRFLAAGLGSLLPGGGATALAMALEVCSGCDLAARAGRWASVLCCAALSVQGASVLLQIRTLCPPEVSFGPLLKARLLHLPLSLGLFRLFLPGGAADVFSTLPQRVTPLRRVPPDCAALAFLGCCYLVCRIAKTRPASREGSSIPQQNDVGAN